MHSVKNLCIMKYNGRSNVRKHILEMINTASKLKVHKLNISEDILVYLSLNSIPTPFLTVQGELQLSEGIMDNQ
jgi:hypothetical protein